MAIEQAEKQKSINPQYYTLETLKNVTTAAAAITLVCGLIMNFYKQSSNHEISLLIINSIALGLCLAVVIANQYRKDPTLNKAQYILLIFFNSVLLYASVAGATGITSGFKNAQKHQQEQSIISFFLPTRPLYGVTEDTYNATKKSLTNAKDSLTSANQIITATKDITKWRKDTLLSNVININTKNVKSIPKESNIQFEIVSLDKLDTIYNTINTYWVYVGQIIDSKWQPKNFTFEELPNKGDEIISNKSIYKRDALPVKLTEDDWRLGKVLGVVNTGQKLKIIDIIKIEDDNYWARVTDK